MVLSKIKRTKKSAKDIQTDTYGSRQCKKKLHLKLFKSPSIIEAFFRSLYSAVNASSVRQARVSRWNKQVPKWRQLNPDIPIKVSLPLQNTYSHISKKVHVNLSRWPSDFRFFVSGVEKNINTIILKVFFISYLNLWFSIL